MPDSPSNPSSAPRPSLTDRLIGVFGATAPRPPDKVGAASPKGGAAPPSQRPDGWRETIESIVVAFVLAFLFRTFEAEAFVIPTGSMAPTLYGQHRDITCEKCGTRFAVGVNSLPSADAEVRFDRKGPYLSSMDRSNFAICPNSNCRFPNYALDREMFAGDRILVNKFPYEFGDPDRFDVVVFKYPEGAKTNYIKRLVALPGEEVRLEGGDVKVRKLGSDDPYRIARKNPEKQRKLQLPVHDNDHPARELLEAGWPEAWAPEEGASWTGDAVARTFRVDPDPQDAGAVQWLRYTNYTPTADVWSNIRNGGKIVSTPQPQEIKDFYAYNARITVRDAGMGTKREGPYPELAPRDGGTEWVGDLTLTCTINVLAAEGELTLELVEGARAYYAVIDLKTGRGSLHFRHEMSSDGDDLLPAGEPFETSMKSTGSYDISFANVDDRLCLWIDDSLVKSLEFDEGSRYEPQRQPVMATERDKAPVGIAARGARLQVSQLRIERDIFYTNEGYQNNRDGSFKLEDSEDDAEDEFLMLGDNSPRSNDSRLWNLTHAVPRRLLIGKAFYIYWPHGVPFLNGGRGFALGKYHERPDGPNASSPLPKNSIPFYPQVGRMKRIR